MLWSGLRYGLEELDRDECCTFQLEIGIGRNDCCTFQAKIGIARNDLRFLFRTWKTGEY
jgi:hypothetical protein